jgi:hypothetical protein
MNTETQVKHEAHQKKMDEQKAKKVAAREWHRDPRRRRSIPPNILV